jgi:S-adenosylmethionine-diacylglycerol 3-amino-3-carboxypropyl transferase
MNNPLKYSNCWEDARLLNTALQVDEHSSVLSISSAGDNSFYLLINNPKKMTCIDMNHVQIYVTMLKEVAIRELSHRHYLEFTGFEDSERRVEIFQGLIGELSAACQNYFLENMHLIERGIINEGKFEQYFQKFAHKVLPLIHTKKRVNRLFETKSTKEQEEFYSKRWNNSRWKFLFKLFFSRFVMGRLGREPEKLAQVEGTVGSMIFNMAEQHLKSVDCQTNYILEYTLKGKFQDHLPPYVEEENYIKIKRWLSSNQINYVTCSLEEALGKGEEYNRYNLSNIFEYMTVEVFEANLNAIYDHSPKGSRMCFWNLMVTREMNEPRFHEEPSPQADMGFFYKKFITYTSK